MIFEKTTGVYERIYRFISKCLKKKEKYANKKYILLALNLKNDDIISYRPGLKMDVKNEIFWSEIRSRFGELCSTPSPRISFLYFMNGMRFYFKTTSKIVVTILFLI